MAEEIPKPAEWIKEDEEMATHRQKAIDICKKYKMSEEDQAQLYGSIGTVVTIKLKRMIYKTRIANKVLESLKKGASS